MSIALKLLIFSLIYVHGFRKTLRAEFNGYNSGSLLLLQKLQAIFGLQWCSPSLLQVCGSTDTVHNIPIFEACPISLLFNLQPVTFVFIAAHYPT